MQLVIPKCDGTRMIFGSRFATILLGGILIAAGLVTWISDANWQAAGCYDAVEAHKRYSPVDGL